MNREDLLKSKEFWLVKIQNDLYAAIEAYMKNNSLTRTQLAEKLNVTKGYITQVLNGDFDHKISKLVELSLSCDVVPLVHFENLDNYIYNDKQDKRYDIYTAVISPQITFKYIKMSSPNKNEYPNPSYKILSENENQSLGVNPIR